jgi:hypothetical protein
MPLSIDFTTHAGNIFLIINYINNYFKGGFISGTLVSMSLMNPIQPTNTLKIIRIISIALALSYFIILLILCFTLY